MNRLAIALLPLLAFDIGTAAAQQPRPAPAVAAIIENQSESQMLGRDIVKARVMSGTSKDAQSFGLIEDLLFDRNGTIDAALVGVGGFLGIGQKTVAVAWSALERADSPGGPVTFITKLTRDQLAAAPAFISAEAHKVAEQKRQVLEKARQQSPASDVLPTPATKIN
jgi:hypothetical protein